LTGVVRAASMAETRVALMVERLAAQRAATKADEKVAESAE